MISSSSDQLSRIIHRFERAIVVTLFALMMLVIVLAAIDLVWIIVEDIITPPIILLEIHELLEIFGFFLLLLIGIELLETMKIYFETKKVSVEIVLEVALIAIARKVIVFEADEYGGITVLGVAALIFALASAYYLLYRARSVGSTTSPRPRA